MVAAFSPPHKYLWLERLFRKQLDEWKTLHESVRLEMISDAPWKRLNHNAQKKEPGLQKESFKVLVPVSKFRSHLLNPSIDGTQDVFPQSNFVRYVQLNKRGGWPQLQLDPNAKTNNRKGLAHQSSGSSSSATGAGRACFRTSSRALASLTLSSSSPFLSSSESSGCSMTMTSSTAKN